MLSEVESYFSYDDFAQEAQYVPSAASTVSLNSQTVGTTYTALRKGTDDNIKLAAKWTQSAASSIKYVSLKLKRTGTIASGKKIWVELIADSSGAPGLVLLASSAVVAADTLSTSDAWVKFTFADPIALSASTVYHLALAGDYSVSGSINVSWRSKTVTSGGNQEIYDASWSAVTTEQFEVYASIPAIFQRENTPSDVGGGVSVINANPTAICKTADVSDATIDATIIIGGVTYNVAEIQPDVHGFTTLILGKD